MIDGLTLGFWGNKGRVEGWWLSYKGRKGGGSWPVSSPKGRDPWCGLSEAASPTQDRNR